MSPALRRTVGLLLALAVLAGCVAPGPSGSSRPTTAADATPTPTDDTRGVGTGYTDCPPIMYVERANATELDRDSWEFVEYDGLSESERRTFRRGLEAGRIELDAVADWPRRVVAYEGANYTVQVAVC